MIDFLILGVRRSGTSLLQSILSSHSKISIPPETGFLRKNVIIKCKLKKLTHLHAVQSNEKLKRLSGIVGELKTKKKWNNALEYYLDFTNKYRISQKKVILGDKDPKLVEYITSVNKIFPEIRIIHIIRDPRDVLLSKMKAAWSKDKPSWYHIFANYVQLKLGNKEGQNLKEKYLAVFYRDLLSSTIDTLSMICEFLNVEFEREMLLFQKTASKLVSEEEKEWKKETMGPLLKDNIGKWQGNLKDWEVALTELLCIEAFQLGGYTKSNIFEQLPNFKKLNVKLIYLILKLLGKVYILHRIYSQNFLIKWKF